VSAREIRQRRESEEALTPAVEFGIARLRRALPNSAKKILANSAWRTLSQHLAGRLRFALEPILQMEWAAWEAVARSLQNTQWQRRAGISLRQAIRDYPEALSTAARLIADWIDAQRELLGRILRDRKLLSENFLDDRQRFRITAIRPGLSDPHDAGRTVTLLKFTGNRRVIYKPRACAAEQIWFEALRWLNGEGLRPVFRRPRLVARQNYCWMEFLQASSCRNSRAVREFYFRWGAQTALAQILRASDLHHENWLAVGAQPILVDAELIESEQSKRASEDRQSLLLETGLLPLSARDGAGVYRGIAPFDPALSKKQRLSCWPRYHGALQAPAKYVVDLVRGFEAVVEIFGKRERAREFLRQIILPMERRTIRRALLRSSAQYARLLRDSLAPPRMISNSQRWRWLKRQCCASAANRCVGLAEARALLRCDLPKFTARSKNVPATCKQIAAAIANLKGGSRTLRHRVLFGGF
jgi:lantibiotic modifying enzyme